MFDEDLVYFVKSESSDSSSSFWQDIKDSFTGTFITENRYELFIEGFLCTLQIMLAAVIAGTLLGFGLFLLYRKKVPGSRILIQIFNAFMDATPMVVMLMIFYYIVFSKTSITNTWVACLCFSMVFASSVFGMLKSSVGAIGQGQYEAAIALGYTDSRAFMTMILPQALRIMLPGYRADIIAMLKSTAIVGYIAVMDLTKVTDIIRSRTYDAFFPLISAAVIYYLMILALSLCISWITARLDPSKRSRSRILKGVRIDD